ncbi:hypothetical protein [Streptomyces sp. NPDC059466]|uniref:hypothetical protein n=1 Tax=unclassified Streptomyces TaxID=2593676 RepID=UPI0036BA13B1
MDVPGLLEAASLLVPEDFATENDITVKDVWEYLIHDEWEVALGLLEELGGVRPLPPGFWQALAASAEQLGLDRSAAWCHWRCYETRHGVVRAGLTLTAADEGRRQAPFSGAGVLRPMWDIGRRTPAGRPDLCVARLWVEFAPSMEPGGRATVRLAPLSPSNWQRLRPGQVITMYEDRTAAGTAVVLDVQGPSALAASQQGAAAAGHGADR